MSEEQPELCGAETLINDPETDTPLPCDLPAGHPPTRGSDGHSARGLVARVIASTVLSDTDPPERPEPCPVCGVQALRYSAERPFPFCADHHALWDTSPEAARFAYYSAITLQASYDAEATRADMHLRLLQLLGEGPRGGSPAAVQEWLDAGRERAMAAAEAALDDFTRRQQAEDRARLAAAPSAPEVVLRVPQVTPDLGRKMDAARDGFRRRLWAAGEKALQEARRAERPTHQDRAELEQALKGILERAHQAPPRAPEAGGKLLEDPDVLADAAALRASFAAALDNAAATAPRAPRVPYPERLADLVLPGDMLGEPRHVPAVRFRCVEDVRVLRDDAQVYEDVVKIRAVPEEEAGQHPGSGPVEILPRLVIGNSRTLAEAVLRATDELGDDAPAAVVAQRATELLRSSGQEKAAQTLEHQVRAGTLCSACHHRRVAHGTMTDPGPCEWCGCQHFVPQELDQVQASALGNLLAGGEG